MFVNPPDSQLEASLEELLSWLFARQRVIQPGLERVRALLKLLGHPERSFRSVLVGGSNGKGSTVQALSAILRSAGYRVGSYTSPHLVRFNERIQVAAEEIPDPNLLRLLREIKPLAEAAGATFFEIATAAALRYFELYKVEWAVLEVGLGGRFDATNAVEPELSIVTNIALEHTEILGDTLAKIGFEKAGIMRTGKKTFSAASGEGLVALENHATQIGAELKVLGRDFSVVQAGLGRQGTNIALKLPGGEHQLFSTLAGGHQAENMALAAVTASELGVGWEQIKRGLEAVRHPGRLERQGQFLFDGAHNPAAAWALREALEQLFSEDPLVLLLAFSGGKNVAEMAKAFSGLGEIVLTRYNSPRAYEPAELAEYFPGAHLVGEPARALEYARKLAGKSGTIVVTGSLYLVGEIKRLLAGLSPEERWQ